MSNKPKVLVAVLCSVVAFSANANIWSSVGDDGNPNTVGNAGAQKSSQTVAPFMLNIVNNTNSVLALAVVKNSSGKTLFTTNSNKKCDLNKVCQIALDKKLIDKNSTIFFYDNKGSLVSAFMFRGLDKNGGSYNASISMDSLGRYVLDKVQKLNPNVNYDVIDMNIITTTLPATPYEELADYYLDLLGNSKDDSSVIKAITKQMAENNAITANSQSIRLMAKNNLKSNARTKASLKSAPPSVKAALDRSNPICSGGFTTAMTLFGSLGFPGAGIISGLAKGASSAACPTQMDYLADQFSKIDAQFNNINNKLVDIKNDLTRIGQNVTKYAVYNQLQTIEKSDNTLFNWVRAYNEILSSPGPDGVQHYDSLKKLMDAYGGVNNALGKIPNLRQNLSKLYDNKAILENIQLLGGSVLTQTSGQMSELCDDANKISGDVMALRMWCNVQSFDIYARNSVLTSFVPSIYDDVKVVYNTDTEPNKKALWTIEKADLDKFSNAVNTNFNPEKNKNIIYPTIKNTDSVYALLKNLEAQKFNVLEWNNGEKYIVTSAIDTEAVSKTPTEIRAKYYYAKPTRRNGVVTYENNASIDSEIVSIMGVPAPKRFFNGGSQNNYGYDPAFPWAEYSVLSSPVEACPTNKGNFDDLVAKASLQTPKNVAAAIYGFGPSDFKANYISQGAYTEKFTRNNKSYQREIFTSSISDQSINYNIKYDGADYWQIANGEFYSFMRYQMADGYTRVWAMRSKIDRVRTDTWCNTFPTLAYLESLKLSVTPQCMTNDCVSVDTGKKLDKLVFKDDKPINIEWTTISGGYSLNVVK
jgi:hypothetical protein